MVEKLASTEIAQSRFEKWAETSPVMDHYGDRDVWDDIWLVAEATYIAAERDTRERIATIIKSFAKDARRLSSLDDAMDGLNELAERIRGKV